jgi:hypothetical protein
VERNPEDPARGRAALRDLEAEARAAGFLRIAGG